MESKRKLREDKRNIVVNTSWTYISEPSPAFKRLMMLLLRPEQSQSEYHGNIGESARPKHTNSKGKEDTDDVKKTNPL